MTRRNVLEEHAPSAQERELGREAIARIKAGPLASSTPPKPRQFAGIPPAPTVDDSDEPESEVY